MTQLDKIKLTKRSVDALATSDRRRIIWDRELKGFGVRLEATGAKTFVVRYRAGGGRRAPRRQMNIGWFGTVTVEQARCDAKRVLGQVAQGKDPVKDRTDHPQGLPHEEQCQGRSIRLHRALLQSPAPSFDAGIPKPNGIRKTSYESLISRP